VLELVLRYGPTVTSFQTLHSGFQYFWHGSDACVGYVDTGKAWVAAGGPLAAPEARAEALAAFIAAARTARRRVCIFAAEEPLRATRELTMRALGIGQQPVWDPRGWSEVLRRHRSLREQLRRARAKGIVTRELAPSELTSGVVRDQIARLTERWLAARAMAPMAFLVQVEPFDFATQRRTFIAERAGRVVGFAGVVPVPGRDGWFLQDLVRAPEAANGTVELLVNAVMLWAGKAQCSFVTLGLAPLSGPLPSRLLRRVRGVTRQLFDFAGLRAFKAKFRPDSWQPVYLCYPSEQSEWRSIFDVLTAFAPSGFARFGLRTLLRGPRSVLQALALLLVPWTLALACAPSERWFGAAWVKWAWVCFDVVLAFGLFRLLRRPASALLTALALAVSADAALTTAQAVGWNAQHVQSALDYLVLALACLGPLLGATVLWGARQHRLRFS
jgi:phosphatidylglycerol lysyltransferase